MDHLTADDQTGSGGALPTTILTKPLSNSAVTLADTMQQIHKILATDTRHREELQALKRLKNDLVGLESAFETDFASYQTAHMRYLDEKTRLHRSEEKYDAGLLTAIQQAIQVYDSLLAEFLSTGLPFLGARRIQELFDMAIAKHGRQPSAAPSLLDRSGQSPPRESIEPGPEHTEARSSDKRPRSPIEPNLTTSSKRQQRDATDTSADSHATTNTDTATGTSLDTNSSDNNTANTSTTWDTNEPTNANATNTTTTTPTAEIRGKPAEEFADIFQNGKAVKKYWIFKTSFTNTETGTHSEFWILRCEEHSRNYANKRGHRANFDMASKHALKHGLPGTDTNILKLFGVAVLNCDRDKMAENNRSVVAASKKEKCKANDSPEKAAAAATAGGGGARPSPRRPRARRRPRTTYSYDEDEGTSRGVIPEPGRFYLTNWEDCTGGEEEWCLSLCLPMSHDHSGFASMGLETSLTSSPLLSMMDKDYEYVAVGDDRVAVRLKPGFPQYEEGGRLASERLYPFLNFDNEGGITESTYGWVPVKDIAQVDLDRLHDKSCLPMAREFASTNQHLLPHLLPALTRQDSATIDDDVQDRNTRGEDTSATTRTPRRPRTVHSDTMNSTEKDHATHRRDIYDFTDDDGIGPSPLGAASVTGSAAQTGTFGTPRGQQWFGPMEAGADSGQLGKQSWITEQTIAPPSSALGQALAREDQGQRQDRSNPSGPSTSAASQPANGLGIATDSRSSCSMSGEGRPRNQPVRQQLFETWGSQALNRP